MATVTLPPRVVAPSVPRDALSLADAPTRRLEAVLRAAPSHLVSTSTGASYRTPGPKDVLARIVDMGTTWPSDADLDAFVQLLRGERSDVPGTSILLFRAIEAIHGLVAKRMTSLGKLDRAAFHTAQATRANRVIRMSRTWVSGAEPHPERPQIDAASVALNLARSYKTNEAERKGPAEGQRGSLA